MKNKIKRLSEMAKNLDTLFETSQEQAHKQVLDIVTLAKTLEKELELSIWTDQEMMYWGRNTIIGEEIHDSPYEEA